MYVYDALSKVRSDIEKRKMEKYLLKVAMILSSAVLGFFVWLGLLMVWTWITIS